MTRFVVLGLILTSIALPQSISMASSSDGAILHFSTSNALKGEPLSLPSVRVFRHAETPIPQPVEIRDSRVITGPYLSSDATTTGIFAYYPCSGSCMGGGPRNLLQLQRNGKEYSFQAAGFRVSRNDRFVFETSFGFGIIAPTLRDLDSGTSGNPARMLSGFSAQSLSNQGAVLSFNTTQVRITPLNLPMLTIFDDAAANIVDANISADGTTVAILAEIPPGKLQFRSYFKLLLIDVATRQQTILFDALPSFVSISTSANGSRLLAVRTGELLLWDKNMGWQSLLSHDEGFSQALLTDQGNAVFAVTGQGRFYQIDTNTGEAKQLYAPFPSTFYQSSFGSYPGSLMRFVVNSAARDLSVKIGSTVLPTISGGSPFLDVQIPWEATELIGQQPLAELTTPDSPFALLAPVQFANGIEAWAFTYRPFNPFPKLGETHWIAAREDFSSLLSPGTPAPAGSVIHLWVTGLGPLNQPLPTGTPGPINPIARPTSSLTCTIAEWNTGSSKQNVRVLDVTYAPNLLGVYQVDLRIPDNWSSTRADIRCTAGSAEPTGALVPVKPR